VAFGFRIQGFPIGFFGFLTWPSDVVAASRGCLEWSIWPWAPSAFFEVIIQGFISFDIGFGQIAC